LYKISDILKDFRVEEVWADYKTSIFDDRNQYFDSNFSLLSRALILYTF
jgi:hypothetical protein